MYKPEFWDKIEELDQWTNKYDPIMTCQPMGLPREGTPARIIQTPTDIILFYTTSDYGGGNIEFRDIAIGGRAPRATVEAYYMGLSHRQMGGRYAGDRFHQLRRYNLVRTRRLAPFPRNAHDREADAEGR